MRPFGLILANWFSFADNFDLVESLTRRRRIPSGSSCVARWPPHVQTCRHLRAFSASQKFDSIPRIEHEKLISKVRCNRPIGVQGHDTF